MRAFADEYFSYLDAAHAGIAGASAGVVGERFADHLEPWLRVLYAVIRATTPLLRFCLQCLNRYPKDPLTVALHDYFGSRIEEEADHDAMLLEDLAKLGLTRASLEHDLPPSAIVSMVGSQYYLIDHLHPAVHLGYIGLLEGYPPNHEDVTALVELSGTTPEAWTTYRLHAELDPEHRRELITVLNAVPEVAWLRRAIIANGIRSAEHYCQCLEAMGSGANRPSTLGGRPPGSLFSTVARAPAAGACAAGTA